MPGSRRGDREALRRWPTLLMLLNTIAFAGVTAVVLDSRLDAWVAVFGGFNVVTVDLPVWIVTAFAVGLIAWVAGVTWATKGG